tara:strand:+ start:8124 stop:8435 length:312 start_codon:yes stop_codon:yes gene_type:complete
MTSPLPRRLRYIRKKQGITQEELGNKLGMEPAGASARISQYETGKHAPDYATVKRISEVLNAPVAYFYCEDDLLAEIVISVSGQSTVTKLEILDFIDSYHLAK